MFLSPSWLHIFPSYCSFMVHRLDFIYPVRSLCVCTRYKLMSSEQTGFTAQQHCGSFSLWITYILMTALGLEWTLQSWARLSNLCDNLTKTNWAGKNKGTLKKNPSFPLRNMCLCHFVPAVSLGSSSRKRKRYPSLFSSPVFGCSLPWRRCSGCL